MGILRLMPKIKEEGVSIRSWVAGMPSGQDATGRRDSCLRGKSRTTITIHVITVNRRVTRDTKGMRMRNEELGRSKVGNMVSVP